MANNINLYMVFTVKSIGELGEVFAVGFIVIAQTGEILQSQGLAYMPDLSKLELTEGQWIEQNILPHLPPATELKQNAKELRTAFWECWQYWSSKGAVLVADRFWSASARFLAACIKDQAETRQPKLTEPVYDVATALLVSETQALTQRLKLELPEHHPICDAALAARLFVNITAKPSTPRSEDSSAS